MNTLPDEIAALEDRDLIERRRLEFIEAERHRDAVRRQAQEADQKLMAARAAQEQLAERHGRGEDVSAQDIVAACSAVTVAKQRADFISAGLPAAEQAWLDARDRHNSAHRDASTAPLLATIRLRIAAARSLDRARAALKAAEQDWAEARAQFEAVRARGSGTSENMLPIWRAARAVVEPRVVSIAPDLHSSSVRPWLPKSAEVELKHWSVLEDLT